MKWKILLAFVSLLAITGCITTGEGGEKQCFLIPVLDWFFAPSATGTAPFQLLGMGLNVLIPGSGTLLGLAGTAYAGFRRASKWKTAFKATAQTIETGAELGMSVADLKPHLADAHAIAGVDGLVSKIVTKLEPDPVTAE
jgi:hypothetical protein